MHAKQKLCLCLGGLDSLGLNKGIIPLLPCFVDQGCPFCLTECRVGFGEVLEISHLQLGAIRSLWLWSEWRETGSFGLLADAVELLRNIWFQLMLASLRLQARAVPSLSHSPSSSRLPQPLARQSIAPAHRRVGTWPFHGRRAFQEGQFGVLLRGQRPVVCPCRSLCCRA